MNHKGTKTRRASRPSGAFRRPALLAAAGAALLFGGGCWSLLGEPGPTYYSRVVDAGAVNAHAHYERGMEQFRRREFAEARRMFLRARQLSPSNPLPTAALIRTELELDSPRRALALAEEAEAQFPGDFEIGLLHAVALSYASRADEARLQLKALRPANATQEALVIRAFGDLRYREGQNDEALRYWHQSLDLDPSQTDLSRRIEQLERFLAGGAE